MLPNTRPTTNVAIYTSWIQTTATLGLFLSLVVILIIQNVLSKEDFADWGWRIPFLLSFILLGISVWIRLSLNESPTFQRMKEEGKGSKAPLSEAFGQWKNARIALLALLGLTAGQAVVWYSGQFYALFFLQNVLKVDAQSVNIMIAVALLLGTGFFVFFGWLSDRIGRKPIIMAGLALAILTYFPLFKALTWAANPALATAQENVRATVTVAPGDCKFQFNPVGTAKFTTSCDVATSFLARNSVPYDVVATAAPGTAATVKIGNETVESYDAVAAGADAAAKAATFAKGINTALQDGGYPLVRDPAKVVNSKLDALVAANPKLALDAAAIRAGEKTMVPVDQAIKDKLITAEEAAGATEVAVYTVPGRRRVQDGRRSGSGELADGHRHPVRPRHLRDDGLRADRGHPGRDVPDPHPLYRHVAALSHRQWLVRRPAPGDGLRHERGQGRYLLRPLVSDRDRGDVTRHRHDLREGHARNRSGLQAVIPGCLRQTEARRELSRRAFFSGEAGNVSPTKKPRCRHRGFALIQHGV